MKIKVGSVSYLNARPLIYGIQRSEALKDKMELIEEFPSKIGKMLVDGQIDVGLVPVAMIPRMKEWHIVSDYVISAEKDVASVCLFSDVPIEEIDTVLLDYQSRTSDNLCKILMKFHWKKDVKFILTSDEYIDDIKGNTAGVIIGDRALIQLKNFNYIYDFAREWRKMTGLPFVFAAWIANKPLPADFLVDFNAANLEGKTHLDEIVANYPFPYYDLKLYFQENIQYKMTEEKKKALHLYLDYLTKIEMV